MHAVEPGTPHEDRPLRELVAQLSRDGSLLVQQEIALAKKELSEKAAKVKTDVMAMVVGGLVLYAGALTLIFAVVMLLAQAVPTWLAALIVGAVVTVVGLVMALGGKKRLEQDSMKPQKTIDSVQRDVEMVKEAVR